MLTCFEYKYYQYSLVGWHYGETADGRRGFFPVAGVYEYYIDNGQAKSVEDCKFHLSKFVLLRLPWDGKAWHSAYCKNGEKVS